MADARSPRDSDPLQLAPFVRLPQEAQQDPEAACVETMPPNTNSCTDSDSSGNMHKNMALDHVDDEQQGGSMLNDHDYSQHQMNCAHINHVHFDPAFEAEDKERCLRSLARNEEKKRLLKMEQLSNHRLFTLVTGPGEYTATQEWYQYDAGFRLNLDGILNHLNITVGVLGFTAGVLGLRLHEWGSRHIAADYRYRKYVSLLRALRAVLEGAGGLTPEGLLVAPTNSLSRRGGGGGGGTP